MQKKIILVLFALVVLLTTSMAASSITINNFSTHQTFYGKKVYSIDFNIKDENGDAHNGHPPVIKLYWGPDQNMRQNLIYSDTNIDNNSGVTCADVNFIDTTECHYNWTVPGFPEMAAGTYYIDANWGYWKSSDVNALQFRYASSGQFNIVQPMDSTMASMIALALFIAAAALAVLFVFRMSSGETSINEAVITSVGVVILIIIGWTLYTAVVVLGV